MNSNVDILQLPEVAKAMIKSYQELKLGGKKVTCPYYINIKRNKDLRAMVGKGDPDEIEMEAKIWEKLKGVSFVQMSEAEIKQFLVDRGLGVDCSGFVVHILDSWFKSINKKHIWACLKIPEKGVLRKLAYLLKPVEKLAAEIITNTENAYPISINAVNPGDLIRSKWKKADSDHVILISKVYKSHSSGQVTKIEYTHSTKYYGEKQGVKIGEIEITDANKPLEAQRWLEIDEKGVNFTLEGYMIQLEDNGLRRLKCMEPILTKLYAQ